VSADILPEIPEWQKRYLNAILDGHPPRCGSFALAGRSAGRALADRYWILSALRREGHTHVYARDGLWCVTGSDRQLATFGPLWERLR